MTVQEFLARLGNVHREGDGWKARCPGHEDSNPSLSVSEGNDGRVLVHDFGGCEPERIVAALGLTLRDLMPQNADDGQQAAPLRTYRWEIRDATGNLVAVHHRRDLPGGRKKHHWERDGKPGLGGLPSRDLPLYGSERLAAAGPGAVVFVVEGEKAADALRERGFPAVGTVTGASVTPSPAAFGVLRGAEVVLWADHDEPGRDHMVRNARVLTGIAGIVRTLSWGEREGDDAADFFARGHTVEELRRALLELRQADLDPTDLGNAKRFAAQHAENVRYCYDLGDWYAYDGTRWARGDMARIERWVKQTVESLHDAARNTADEERREELHRAALRSQTKQRIESLLFLARSEEAIEIKKDQLDANDWLLNCANGTLDLTSGTLLSHRREDLITRRLPVAFDPDAQCPTFEAFLARIMDNNSRLIAFLQRAVGYSLTGSTREQVLLFLWGAGANGKTTFLNAIENLLGDYAGHTPSETLLARRDITIPNDVARLFGLRFVSAVEAGEGRRLDEAKVKELTGGDTITARFLFHEFFSFRPKFKLWFATNHRPEIRGTDWAIWRRIILTPFTVTIPEKDRDPDLGTRLATELPGILNWAAAGCLLWQKLGLAPPEEVLTATSTYRAEQDLLGEFLTDRCRLDTNATTPSKDLYEAYTKWWVETTGGKPIANNTFGRQLRERNLTNSKGTHGKRLWHGIALLPEDLFR